MKRIVIVGTGLAGYTVAREMRKLDSAAQLTLLTADDGGFYSKPMLSNAFAQGKTPETLVNLRVEQMASQLKADIRPNTIVTEIDGANHVVRWADGETGYDKLVLALGARPIRLPFEGSAAQSVLSVNNLRDYAEFRRSVTNVSRILLIGGGLIGCEFANDLLKGGFSVTLIHRSATLLDALAPAIIGEGLRAKLTAAGVSIETGASVTHIDHAENGELIARLADGREFETPCILSAIGLTPSTNMASEAGLKVNRGIVTDRYLATSHQDIYALGDCAEVDGVWLPYVMPIMNQARALAKTLHGENTAVNYPIMPVIVKTPVFPVVVVPPPKVSGTWQTQSELEGAKALFYDDDKQLRGFALGGQFTSEKAALSKEVIP